MTAENKIKGRPNPKVDFFFTKATRWKEEFGKLREFVLDSGLEEDLKWGQACYTLEKKNVIIIHGFKEYCGLMFFKGVLIDDPKGILIQQTENVQTVRQIRFTSLSEIVRMERTIKTYIKNAIEVEKSGKKVKLKTPAEFKMAEEFQIRLDKSAALRKAFYSLTPGRQRAYLLHFSQPKLSITRESRIEKSLKQILDGKGLGDD